MKWIAKNIEKVSIQARDKCGATTKDLYIVLTGKPAGLPLWEFLEIQGKKATMEWLDFVINKK